MTQPSTGVRAPVHQTSHPFPRILCDASDDIAVGQAVALAAGAAAITFLAVADQAGDAAERLERAAARAANSTSQLVTASTPLNALLARAAAHDVVVVGAPHLRPYGIARQEATTHLLHRSPVPVLVARPGALTSHILATTQGRPAARPALTTATRLAVRFGSELTVLHIREPHDEDRQNEIMAELDNVRAMLGRPIQYVVDWGGAAARILAAARADSPGVIVVGSGLKRGLSAVTSTSENVAHGAPCSVLVVREP